MEMDAVVLARPEGCRPFVELLYFSPNPKDLGKLKEGRGTALLSLVGIRSFAWDRDPCTGQRVGTWVRCQIHRSRIPELVGATKTWLWPPLGVKGTEATCSGSLHVTPACLL